MQGKEGQRSVWGGVDVVIEALGCRGDEIARSLGDLTSKASYRAGALNIGWPWDMIGGPCGEDSQREVEIVLKA
jgi:hypothetical protein